MGIRLLFRRKRSLIYVATLLSARDESSPGVAGFVHSRSHGHHRSHYGEKIVSPSPSPEHSSSAGCPIIARRSATARWAHPTPDFDGPQVVTLCMDALEQKTANEALEICFAFSSDRCRAAVGGTLEEFVRYADNPVFGTLVNCDSYEIISVGPIIPAAAYGLGSRRGEMQTFLVEIKEGMSMKTVLKAAEQRARKRPTVEERLRQRELKAAVGQGKQQSPNDEIMAEQVNDGKRRFLWTLQKEIRPPRQDCWLVHEVLFTKNAIHQTY